MYLSVSESNDIVAELAVYSYVTNPPNGFVMLYVNLTASDGILLSGVLLLYQTPNCPPPPDEGGMVGVGLS